MTRARAAGSSKTGPLRGGVPLLVVSGKLRPKAWRQATYVFPLIVKQPHLLPTWTTARWLWWLWPLKIRWSARSLRWTIISWNCLKTDFAYTATWSHSEWCWYHLAERRDLTAVRVLCHAERSSLDHFAARDDGWETCTHPYWFVCGSGALFRYRIFAWYSLLVGLSPGVLTETLPSSEVTRSTFVVTESIISGNETDLRRRMTHRPVSRTSATKDLLERDLWRMTQLHRFIADKLIATGSTTFERSVPWRSSGVPQNSKWDGRGKPDRVQESDSRFCARDEANTPVVLFVAISSVGRVLNSKIWILIGLKGTPVERQDAALDTSQVNFRSDFSASKCSRWSFHSVWNGTYSYSYVRPVVSAIENHIRRKDSQIGQAAAKGLPKMFRQYEQAVQHKLLFHDPRSKGECVMRESCCVADCWSRRTSVPFHRLPFVSWVREIL